MTKGTFDEYCSGCITHAWCSIKGRCLAHEDPKPHGPQCNLCGDDVSTFHACFPDLKSEVGGAPERPRPLPELAAEVAEALEDDAAALGYLTRLLKFCAPHVTPLPTLIGLAVQLDNYIAGLQIQLRDAAPRPAEARTPQPDAGIHVVYLTAGMRVAELATGRIVPADEVVERLNRPPQPDTLQWSGLLDVLTDKSQDVETRVAAVVAELRWRIDHVGAARSQGDQG